MHETDLACSTCGTELTNHHRDTRDLPVSTPVNGHIQVAECPTCTARYDPDRTLRRLAGRHPARNPDTKQ